MFVTGLSGKMGCGKTEIARELVSRFPQGLAKRVSFGDPVKAEVSAAFEIPIDLFYTPEGKATPVFVRDYPGLPSECMNVRELLQWWGTDYRRAQNPRYWVEAMGRHLLQLEQQGFRYVFIDDVRFPDEAELVLQKRGLLYRIQPYIGWEPGPHAGHSSETALDDFEGFAAWLHPAFGDLNGAATRIFQQVIRGGYV